MTFLEKLELTRMLPSPTLREGASGAARRPVKRIILFGRHPSPTSDYYFRARLTAAGMPSYVLVDIRDEDFTALDPDGAFVVFCRYASASSLRWLEESIDRLAGVGLFLDDDIPAVIASSESSLPYKVSLFINALWPLRRLNRHLDIVWASTPDLARQLIAARPRVLPPAPSRDMWHTSLQSSRPSNNRSLLIAYHATGIHVAEHYFLRPVIEDVLSARPNVLFEVFANGKTSHLWRNMDRVKLRKAVSWPQYLEESATRKIDIMLVPLISSKINNSRSSTKRIDIVRMGAAGIFSVSKAYGAEDCSGEIRIPTERGLWRQAILDLIDNPRQRASAADATRVIVQKMTEEAEKGLHLG